jgi:hypothetical protein
MSKRKTKLTLREIMATELATPTYLSWSKVPIEFTRAEQWTSFSNAGCYPLVLDITVEGVQLTKVLINGSMGLNIIFAS